MKVYKSSNPNKKRVGALFILQVVFGMLPAVLFVLFAINMTDELEKTYITGYISAAAIVLCAFAYFILGRRYNILLSGLKGEKSLAKIAKKHKNEFDIFLNCPIQYRRSRSEIDMVMLGKGGIIIVEVKNHSGTISGSDTDETWSQFKHYRDGKNVEGELKNPIKQITRQRDILKNILREEGINAWVESVVFFSNPFVRLKLNLKNHNSIVCAGEKELEQFISEFRSAKKLSDEEIKKVKDTLKALM